jgi:hypothetical protein
VKFIVATTSDEPDVVMEEENEDDHKFLLDLTRHMYMAIVSIASNGKRKDGEPHKLYVRFEKIK